MPPGIVSRAAAGAPPGFRCSWRSKESTSLQAGPPHLRCSPLPGTLLLFAVLHLEACAHFSPGTPDATALELRPGPPDRPQGTLHLGTPPALAVGNIMGSSSSCYTPCLYRCLFCPNNHELFGEKGHIQCFTPSTEKL